MSQASYTQIALVKNPYQVLRNCDIALSKGLIGNYTTRESSPIGGYTYLGKKYNNPIIIVPGFINLHAHLAYTHSKTQGQELFNWLLDLVAEQFSITKTCLLPQHLNNAKAAIASGTTFIVDNSSSPAQSLEAYKQTGLRGIIGIEVFGSDPELAEEIFAAKVEEIEKLSKRLNDRTELCFSPHATYDVSVKLWRLLLGWTRRHCEAQNAKAMNTIDGLASLATTGIAPLLLSHAAESEAEEAWFQNKDSDKAATARKFWQSINTLEAKLKHWQPYRSSTYMLATNNLLDPCLLLTHLCCASDEDLELLAKAKVNLVTCPRSNAYLNNPPARISKWSSNFGIGTDSLASNYDWDLRCEVNKLKSLSPVQKLELLTTKPAKILNKQLGALEPGYAADFTIFELQQDDIDLGSADPIELLFDENLTKPVATYIAGDCLYQAH